MVGEICHPPSSGMRTEPIRRFVPPSVDPGYRTIVYKPFFYLKNARLPTLAARERAMAFFFCEPPRSRLSVLVRLPLVKGWAGRAK